MRGTECLDLCPGGRAAIGLVPRTTGLRTSSNLLALAKIETNRRTILIDRLTEFRMWSRLRFGKPSAILLGLSRLNGQLKLPIVHVMWGSG